MLLRSRQISLPREIDKPQGDLFDKPDGAEKIYWKNKKVKSSKTKSNQILRSHLQPRMQGEEGEGEGEV
jgi:hypothetical protein